jgi:hypothetical protein
VPSTARSEWLPAFQEPAFGHGNLRHLWNGSAVGSIALESQNRNLDRAGSSGGIRGLNSAADALAENAADLRVGSKTEVSAPPYDVDFTCNADIKAASFEEGQLSRFTTYDAES